MASHVRIKCYLLVGVRHEMGISDVWSSVLCKLSIFLDLRLPGVFAVHPSAHTSARFSPHQLPPRIWLIRYIIPGIWYYTHHQWSLNIHTLRLGAAAEASSKITKSPRAKYTRKAINTKPRQPAGPTTPGIVTPQNTYSLRKAGRIASSVAPCRPYSTVFDISQCSRPSPAVVPGTAVVVPGSIYELRCVVRIFNQSFHSHSAGHLSTDCCITAVHVCAVV